METAPFRASRCSPAPASRGQVECEDKGGDQYGALDEILHVVRGVHHGQPLKKNTHEQRARCRAESVRPRGAQHRRATAFVEKMPSGAVRIRLNFVDNSVAFPGAVQQSRPVQDAAFYQATFELIDKAIFVRSATS